MDSLQFPRSLVYRALPPGSYVPSDEDLGGPLRLLWLNHLLLKLGPLRESSETARVAFDLLEELTRSAT